MRVQHMLPSKRYGGRDLLASHDASQRAAERIPGARFVSLESGGHLMLGQQKKGRDELARFFAERSDRRAEQVAS